MSCLLVVLVSFLSSSSPMVITASVIATVYAFIWDVFVDWGLGMTDFFDHVPTWTTARRRSFSSPNVSLQTSLLHGNSLKDDKRLLPKRIFWLCSALDLLARSTWVLTLMPARIITQNLGASVALVSFMSSAEILRRSFWTILRIECEQTTNASGFRAILWVPSSLNVAGTEELPSL